MINFLRNLVLVIVFLTSWNTLAEEGNSLAQQKSIPFRNDDAAMEEQGMRVLIVLLTILGVATGGLLYLRWRSGRWLVIDGTRSASARLRVIERLRLSPSCTLFLVQFDGREIVFAQCGDSVTPLDVIGRTSGRDGAHGADRA